ncbi:uncharacterized protein [Cardiocondyla obscurior]|uniref:uncharacterized protein n=1 Tax=Cardiocondyla obscurior TaxID=286306 RepID=UPI003965894D
MSRQSVPPPGINSCERIRPERPRNTIQRLVWGPGTQFQVGHIGILEDEGSNPRMALRRLLRLYEGRQYREAAGFLMKLPHYTLKASLPDIPVDLLIETLPHSLTLLEALYSRLMELNVSDTKILRIEQVLWRIVHLISTSQDHFRPRIWCKLLVSLNRLSPNTKNILLSRRRALERAVEGLGKHGLVPSAQNISENSVTPNLVPLPVALKEELETRMEAYKLALHKIENFGKHAGTNKGMCFPILTPSNMVLRDARQLLITTNKRERDRQRKRGKEGEALIFSYAFVADQGVQAASHQRQLSLKYSEIQQRLIDNQSLLNTLEKAGGLCRLENLLAELKHRVEQDKEALRQWTALRKSTSGPTNTKNPALAARLLQFARGCALALQFMSEDNPQVRLKTWALTFEGLGVVEKMIAKHVTTVRTSVTVPAGLWFATLSASASKTMWWTMSKLFPQKLKCIMNRDNRKTKKINIPVLIFNKIFFFFPIQACHLDENLGDDYEEESSSAGYHTDESCSPTPEPVVTGSACEALSVEENCSDLSSASITVEQLTERYVALYAQANLHTLDALDALESLKNAPDLKAKILYSVVVVSTNLNRIIGT